LSEQKNTSHDNAIAWTILSIVFLAIAILFWHYKGDAVKDGVRWLRVMEIWAASWFVDDESYNVPWRATHLNFAQWYEYAVMAPREGLAGNAMNQISTLALYPFRYVITLLLLVMGFWALFNGPKTQYRHKLDINTLIKRQSSVFPAIRPFILFNPSTQPPRPPGAPVPAELPQFAEALSPEEWVAYHDIPVPDGKVDQEVAGRAFAKQLGPPWRGAMHMAPYRQVLLAAFCLKSMRKRSDADKLLGDLAASWSFTKGMNIPAPVLKQARKVLRNRDIAGKILANCNQHAYENTALLRALQTAREEGGVMAPAQFVWMRGFDRTLWYPLNNLGRQAYHMEALGAICHFKAEKVTARPIPRAKIEDAVLSITEYMASSKARPIPPLDYSRSKKRAIKKVKGT
jgi:intracellular multiplication protein IcmP